MKREFWGERILKPQGISSVARRKAVGIGSLKISLWDMPPEKTHILLQDFFYMPVMAMKATNESFYQEQKIWVLAPEAFSAQVGK